MLFASAPATQRYYGRKFDGRAPDAPQPQPSSDDEDNDPSSAPRFTTV